MKGSRTFRNLPVCAALLTALLPVPASLAQGQAAPATQEASRAEADVKACKDQLNRIFEALQSYQEQNKNLPDWLGDLHPKFIADLKPFVCPVVHRLGDLSSWRAGVRNDLFWDPVLPTSYTYEFCAKELHLAPGIQTTWHEYKKRQRSLVGDHVPVVRCFAHGPEMILNLAIGGRVYPSGRYWEDEYTRIVSHEELTPESVFRDLLTSFLKQPRSYPPRSTAADVRQLDLTRSYNLGLNETYRYGSAGEADFGSLPQGVVKLEHVDPLFDIRGRIQLKGKRLRMPFPDRVDGIQIDQQCQRVHLLCGTVYFATNGAEIGRFEVRYADGQSNRIPILYGKHVQDWSFDPQKPQTGDARVAWQGASPAGPSSQARGKLVRLFHLQWENPLSEVRIATLDFVSALTDAAPFLIAITLE